MEEVGVVLLNRPESNEPPSKTTLIRFFSSPHAARVSISSSLRELRQNVARLLVNQLPALELDQVNYDCNVIDEIFEQYLENQ